MRILPATFEHLDALAPLFVTYREFYQQLPSPEASRRFLEERIKNQDARLFLAMADDEDKILGFIQLFPSLSSLSLKPVWVLNDIYVVPEARRQLVADRLILKARELAQREGVIGLRAATRQDNEVGHELYRSMGFQDDDMFKHFSLTF